MASVSHEHWQSKRAPCPCCPCHLFSQNTRPPNPVLRTLCLALQSPSGGCLVVVRERLQRPALTLARALVWKAWLVPTLGVTHAHPARHDARLRATFHLFSSSLHSPTTRAFSHCDHDHDHDPGPSVPTARLRFPAPVDFSSHSFIHSIQDIPFRQCWSAATHSGAG